MKKTKKSENVKDYINNIVENSSNNSTGTNILPKSATPYFSFLFIGLLLILFGGITYFFIRKKRKN